MYNLYFWRFFWFWRSCWKSFGKPQGNCKKSTKVIKIKILSFLGVKSKFCNYTPPPPEDHFNFSNLKGFGLKTYGSFYNFLEVFQRISNMTSKTKKNAKNIGYTFFIITLRVFVRFSRLYPTFLEFCLYFLNL